MWSQAQPDPGCAGFGWCLLPFAALPAACGRREWPPCAGALLNNHVHSWTGSALSAKGHRLLSTYSRCPSLLKSACSAKVCSGLSALSGVAGAGGVMHVMGGADFESRQICGITGSHAHQSLRTRRGGQDQARPCHKGRASPAPTLVAVVGLCGPQIPGK